MFYGDIIRDQLRTTGSALLDGFGCKFWQSHTLIFADRYDVPLDGLFHKADTREALF